jgi:glycosyltransferase involved in cell wall biosynthesis
MAAGMPVIALREGGVAESVTEQTGVFFSPQTVEAVMEAIEKVESGQVQLSETACRKRASEFSRERFQREMIQVIQETWAKAGKDLTLLDDAVRMPK